MVTLLEGRHIQFFLQKKLDFSSLFFYTQQTKYVDLITVIGNEIGKTYFIKIEVAGSALDRQGSNF